MRTVDKGKTIYREFESAGEYVQYASAVSEKRYEEHATGLHNASFCGRDFATWKDVENACATVWEKGLSVLERMTRTLDDVALPSPRSRRRRTRFREDNGDELDYDRLRSGRDYWRTSRRELASGPATITVMVEVSANGSVKHQDILWRGAAAIALTKKLEAAGYRVELWAFDKTERLWGRGPGHGFDTAVVDAICLKRPSDPLDESTLISSVSGWFYRTVVFRADCAGKYRIAAGLGRAVPLTPEDLDEISRDENRILIAQAYTFEAACDQVRDAIANLKT